MMRSTRNRGNSSNLKGKHIVIFVFLSTIQAFSYKNVTFDDVELQMIIRTELFNDEKFTFGDLSSSLCLSSKLGFQDTFLSNLSSDGGFHEELRKYFFAAAKIRGVSVIKEAVEVHFENERIKFEDCWLRDHCRCSSCYHADTFQRAQHILDIPDSKIADIAFTESQVIVIWDDEHKSIYDAEFLIQYDYKTWKDGQRLKPVLWHGGSVAEQVARIHIEMFLKTEEAAKKVFQSLLDYGVALIEGVEPNLEATEQVCKALGGVQHTIFGGMWEFTTKADHADTAYTNLPLAVHNDSTYFTESTGLQILHCIEHSGGLGGETVLVDGFYGANQLRKESPEDFDFLTTFDLEAEYIEEGHHHKHAAPVISVDKKTMDLKQIRFNVYDRAPMAFVQGEECRKYYHSLRSLAKYYQDAGNQWQFKLKPGLVMVMDNFRVLHGRTGFSGKRVLCGSYVARSDWLDRARALRLIR